MTADYATQVRESLDRLYLATGKPWEYEHTGGGHDGFVFYPVGVNPDAYYMVTVAGDAIAPLTEEDWDNVALGWYDDDADDMPEGFRMVPEVTNLATLAEWFRK